VLVNCCLLVKSSLCTDVLAIDLVSKLLQVTMRKRFTVDKSLSHIWLQVNTVLENDISVIIQANM